MAKKPGAKPSPEPKILGPEEQAIHEGRRRVAEAFYERIIRILEHTLKLWEAKVLNDPGYQVSPQDVAGIIQAVQRTEELLFTYSHLSDYMGKAREEMKRLEAAYLSLLTSGPEK